MNDELIRPAEAQKATILILTLGISVVFVALVSDSLIALFLGAVFSGLAYPSTKKSLRGSVVARAPPRS